MTKRLEAAFERAKSESRGALGIFISAGDPHPEVTPGLMDALVENGADFIELGMPFSDPMADGPAIQAASLRAIKAGTTLESTLAIARDFRSRHPEVPLILMGYYNPIYIYGNDRFLKEAAAAGVDGLIIVDLPVEEDDELCLPAQEAGIDFIRLVTPTTQGERLKRVLDSSSGFIYYVAVAGITGTKSASTDSIKEAMDRIHAVSDLPAVVGFGIRTPEQAAEAGQFGAGVVVGSAVVDIIAKGADSGTEGTTIIQEVGAFCGSLSAALKK